tara:strand:- start:21 stop:437 length:417 start_codon:yes stop_codon:yes gene_type:complete
LKESIEKIIADFSFFSSWEEKYEYLIDLGFELSPLSSNLKTENNLIAGCQSKVWLTHEYKEKKLYFYGDSDALITRGIVALIIKLYSGHSPEELLKENGQIFSIIGLRENLSMNRANGLSTMVKAIKSFALKYIKNER